MNGPTEAGLSCIWYKLSQGLIYRKEQNRSYQSCQRCHSSWSVSILTSTNRGSSLKVWKAEAENICGYDGTIVVAVKTTKENAPEKEKLDLLQEMKIMQTIGHHPNVVTLIGVCTEKGQKIFVFFSFFISIWGNVFVGNASFDPSFNGKYCLL